MYTQFDTAHDCLVISLFRERHVRAPTISCIATCKIFEVLITYFNSCRVQEPFPGTLKTATEHLSIRYEDQHWSFSSVSKPSNLPRQVWNPAKKHPAVMVAKLWARQHHAQTNWHQQDPFPSPIAHSVLLVIWFVRRYNHFCAIATQYQ